MPAEGTCRKIATWPCAILLAVWAPWLSAAERLEVEDIVAAPRFLTSAAGAAAFLTPDSSHFMLAIVQPNIDKNVNQLLLEYGSLSSLDTADQLETIATLATSSLGNPARLDGLDSLTLPLFNSIVWTDAEQFTFFWDFAGSKQVFRGSVHTRQVAPITHHPTGVLTYAFHPDGHVIYAAELEISNEQSRHLAQEGFVVRNPDALSLLNGDLDGTGLIDRSWNSEWFLAVAGSSPRKVQSIGPNLAKPFQARFAPDGRHALISSTPTEIPPQWAAYLHIADEMFAMQLREALNDSPRGFMARQLSQLFVVDVRTATARPLWNAPNPTVTEENFSWSPDGKHVLIATPYLPLQKGSTRKSTTGDVAVANIEDGTFARLPIRSGKTATSLDSTNLRWLDNDCVELTLADGTQRFARRHDRWVAVPALREPDRPRSPPRIGLVLRQDLNTPPVLYAVDQASGDERVVADLYADLRARFQFGHVERIAWSDQHGRTWGGILTYPVSRVPGRRVPLVLGTQGNASHSEFSLSGLRGIQPGIGPSTSVYAAQVLANRGIAVLDVEDRFIPGVTVSPAEAEAHLAAYESAIGTLSDRGLIDPAKVGLVGFSRSGWYVEYALTHSDFRFAAALTSDNIDAGYFQATLVPGFFVQEIGARPFGEGLQQWLRRAPPFNAERVITPLRMQVETGPMHMILAQWEMFSRLRQLHKPVELYVIPDVEHGAHNIQNPRQSIVNKAGAVDWFDFWLNDVEDPAAAKAAQYERWRALRDLDQAPTEKTQQEQSAGHGPAAATARN